MLNPFPVDAEITIPEPGGGADMDDAFIREKELKIIHKPHDL